jgi:predicted MPP superfamily phosphohydrolase
MGAIDCFYNLLMGAADAVSLRALARHRTGGGWLRAVLVAGTAAMVLAAILRGTGGSAWRVMRLASYGLFVHGLIVLAGAAALLARLRPTTAIVSGLIAACLVGVAVDAFLFEPTWLDVARYRLASPKITRPMRIVVVADLQADAIGWHERGALQRALDERPDLILLAGDHLQTEFHQASRLHAELNQLLRELRFSAPLGVFAVRGNIEWDHWAEAFAGLPIRAVEQTETFDVGEIRLTCLSADDSFHGRELKSIARDPGRFHLILGHSPNFARARTGADLLVAGHTHGGQVRLPLVGPIMTNTRVPRRLASGWHDLPDGTKLLVSRGVGMERGDAPRVRFLCRPELVVIDLEPL